MTANEAIKYCQKEARVAFDNAIIKGMKNPENYMYMYSDFKYDYFKHVVTRKYINYNRRIENES